MVINDGAVPSLNCIVPLLNLSFKMSPYLVMVGGGWGCEHEPDYYPSLESENPVCPHKSLCRLPWLA